MSLLIMTSRPMDNPTAWIRLNSDRWPASPASPLIFPSTLNTLGLADGRLWFPQTLEASKSAFSWAALTMLAEISTISSIPITQVCNQRFCHPHLILTKDASDLNQLLKPINAGHNRSEGVARCEPGTRVELTTAIMRWIGEDGPPICWLSGSAGSGKSAVSQTVAEICNDHEILAASFFFPGPESESTVARFIHTIAYQLSISAPTTKPLIQQNVQDDPSILGQSLGHQFKKLLVEPARDANLTQPIPMVIIVDALDECNDKDSMAKFIEIIIDASADRRQFPFRIFLTSKVEEHLRKKLEGPADRRLIHPLNLQDFDASDDIHRFLQSQLSRIYRENSRKMQDIPLPWPSKEDVETLVEKAGGSFLCAVNTINSIDDGTDMPHRRLTALTANGGGRRRFSSPRIFRWPSRSSQHSSASSAPPETATCVHNGGSKRAGVNAQRAKTLGAYLSSHTPEPAIANKPPISWIKGVSIEATTVDGLIAHLILPCKSKASSSIIHHADDLFRFSCQRTQRKLGHFFHHIHGFYHCR